MIYKYLFYFVVVDIFNFEMKFCVELPFEFLTKMIKRINKNNKNPQTYLNSQFEHKLNEF